MVQRRVGQEAGGDGARQALLVEQVEDGIDQLGVDASGFAQAATAARYGPPAGARRAANSAREELRELKRRLRRSLSRFDRARGLLSVRSLGLG